MPAGVLGRLCALPPVEFDPRMLVWPAGPRPTDGNWARYWYHVVERSTGFQPPDGAVTALPPELEALAEECQPHYLALAKHKLSPRTD